MFVFTRISQKMTLALVVMSVLPLLLASEIFLNEYERQVTEAELTALEQLTDKKLEQITAYIDERIADIELLARDPSILESMAEMEYAYTRYGVESDAYAKADQKIRVLTRNFLTFGYYDLFFVAPNGEVIYTVVHEDDFASNLFDGPYRDTGLAHIVRNAFAVLEADASSFQYYPPSDELAAFLATPVISDDKILGVLALQIDIQRIFAVVSDSVGMGESGETLISRHAGNMVEVMVPVSRTEYFSSMPDPSWGEGFLSVIRQVLNGNSGHKTITDFQGKTIVSAWRYLPVLRWGVVVKKDAAEVFASVTNMRKRVRLLVVALFIGCVALAYFVAGSIVRPIKQLTGAVQNIAHGEKGQRVQVKSRDEVAELAVTFNLMMEQLEQTHLALVNKVIEVEQANEAKSQFLSRMSHELRTPMNAILGFAQMLDLDADQMSQVQCNNVNEILVAGNHLLALINDVLDIARIESGRMQVHMDDVDISDVVIQCLKLIEGAAREREIDLIDLNLRAGGFHVRGDMVRVKQVLLNLLTNAVKYNRQGGRIILNGEIKRSHYLRISVSDTGKGIATEDMDKLFIPFERLDTVNNVEGTGIGLVITKHLVGLMGGEIGVESTKEKGSVFWVEFEVSNHANHTGTVISE